MRKASRVIVLLIVLTQAGACSTARVAQEPPAQPAPAETAASQPASEAPAGESSVAEIVAELDDLDLDSFFEASYRQLLLRNPEKITELGLTEALGVGNDQLTDISDSYLRETQELEAAVLELLNDYDRAQMSPEQQLSADIYGWYLEDQVRGHAFTYHDYPASFLITTGVQEQLIQFFADIHPIASQQDAEDYVARLSQVDTKLDQLIDGLRRREEAGVVMPGFLIPWTLYSVRNVAQSSARSTPFFTAFEEKVNLLQGPSPEDKQSLLEAAENEINESVIPGFRALAECLERQQAVATDDEGIWKLADGEAYYAYLLRHYTTTDMTADEIHQLGLEELERIHAEMRVVFDRLGYPEDESLPALIGRVVRDSGTVSGGEIAATYEALIEAADQRIGPAFDLRPAADVIVVAGPAGDYYSSPAIDGSRPGMFYARVTGSEPRFGMPTLTYHETIPGHHLQLAVGQELDLPLFRKDVSFMAFVEGWALYAEQLAWELGFYEEDPYGDIGRLQAEAFRAARLVVDTGIHAKGWSYDEAVEFMLDNTGLPPDQVEIEVARYIVWPGQAVAYKIGMIKILELRQKAMDELGDRFDLTEFHNVVLGSGGMPLEILDRVVDDYIEAEMSR
jgi:uncharacterized protein (DUF885 family)